MRVTILITEGTILSSAAIPLDVFHSAGTLWNSFEGKETRQYFDVRLASPGGAPVGCFGAGKLTADVAMEDAPEADLLVVAAAIGYARGEGIDERIIQYLLHAHQSGVKIASICTGAFLLAATNLLNGRSATTHWGLAERLQHLYPEIHVRSNRIITDEGNLFCSGGANAGGDLALYLVRKFYGEEVAMQCSRAMVLDPYRTSQAPYAVSLFDKRHGDTAIAALQEWLEKNCHKQLSIGRLAERAAMSRRTFERRFKQATGETPLQYIRTLRIEQAKSLLEGTENNFENITEQIGYGDSSTFRRLFEKSTGLTPGEYRRRFRCRATSSFEIR